MLKKIFYFLIALILLLLIGSVFISGKYHLERSTYIHAPATLIFEQVNTLKNWEKWSPWEKMDPQMEKSYNNISAGILASYSWKGKKTGEGKMTIIKSVPGELVESQLDFGKNGLATSGHRFEQTGDSVKVTWYFDSDNGNNPIAKYMTAIMGGMMKGVFEDGLKDLKNLCENMPRPQGYVEKVEEIEMKETLPYLGIKTTCTMENISAEMGKNYGLIMSEMKKQGVEFNPKAPPAAIYYKWENNNFEFDAIIPTNKPGIASGSVFTGEIQSGNYIVAHYLGAYKDSHLGHEAARAYAISHGKIIKGVPMEMYMNDPGIEKDTLKWKTDVYYQIN
jgi:hypothetical protein